VGDYRGRRRGHAASEPSREGAQSQEDDQFGHQGNAYYADEAFGGSNYRDGYQDDGYQDTDAAAAGYADESGADHASDYAEPRFDFQQRQAPQAEAAQYGQPHDPGHGYDAAPGYEAVPGYDPEQFYAPAPESARGARRGRPAAEPEYAPGYTPEYPQGYDDFGYTEGRYDTAAYADSAYADPGRADPGYDAPPYAPGPLEAEPFVPAQQGSGRRGSRRSRPADEGRYAPGTETDGYGPDHEAGHDPARRPGRGAPQSRDTGDDSDFDAESEDTRRPAGRPGTATPNHLPFVAAATVALIASGFVAPKATAAVTVLLQIAAAFAVRDLLRMPGRRPAIVAAVPAVAATAGTFGFTSDVAANAIAAGLGAGFVLAAGDMVLRTRRRGVHRGAARDLAASVTALLIACMTALLTAAARQSATAVAIGGVVYGILALVASRNRELTSSRAAVLGLPAAAAALAAYAAAILVA
jgi:hypothetical protein